MLYYLTAAALALHTYFWGAGLAWLVLPRRWQRGSWAFAPGFGLALQSAVVWLGAHLPVAGTNEYAWWSELLPLLLLLVAWGRAGWPNVRKVGIKIPLALVLLITGWMLLSPMAGRGAWTLSSSSLGSCDHADYAAGARVLQEFSRDDRTGFLGQPEVTRVGSAETFFDFWLRLNHFTPSALLAHNGSILGLKAHELVSLSGALLVLLNLPVVLLLARIALGLRGLPLVLLALLYAFSPLTMYAVYHGALGQLYAAQGIGLLTLAVFGAGRACQRGGSAWPYAPLAFAAFWLLAGSYNFILTVALAPGGAWLLAEAGWRRDVRSLGRTLLMLTLTFALCVVVFWGRFGGLHERFVLFNQFNFGWPVPLLTPEGWLGLVRGLNLQAWPPVGRFALSGTVLALWLGGGWTLWRQRNGRAHALAALALVLPVAGGWGILAWESFTRANASYDVFKIISVFYPGLLAGLGCWLVAAQRGSRRARLEAGVLLAAILTAQLSVDLDFSRRMLSPPLRVDRSLVELGRLEENPQVTSLNMSIDDFWGRLWANAFLLKKPQYFPTHTYEGRLNTPLRGEWDLSDSLVRSVPFSAADIVQLNARFHAIRVGAPGRVGAQFADGWHQLEGQGLNRWRWTSGEARLRLHNPASGPLPVRLTLRVIGITPRDLILSLNDARIGSRRLDGSLQTVSVGDVVLPPGDSVLSLRSSSAPAIPAGGRDLRLLSFALHGMTIQALPPRPAPGTPE